MKAKFNIPRLSTSGKYWYISIIYNKKEYRYKHTLNQIKDLDEKKSEGESLCASYLLLLRTGQWNPIDKYKDNSPEAITLSVAIDFAFKKKADKAPKTYAGYKGAIKLFTPVIEKLGYDKMNVRDIRKFHVMQIIDATVFASDHAYNKYVIFLKGLFTVMLKYDYIDFSPAARIDEKEVVDSDLHRPPTDEELQLIIPALIEHPDYFVFCSFIYYTLCRESELLAITASMVNLKKREITLPASICKNRSKGRIVPINDFMYHDLINMGVHEVPGNYFIFGTFKSPAKRGFSHDTWFVPAPYKIHENRCTDRWKKIVKDGLRIDVTLYSLKSLGADMFFEQGASVKMVSELAGHQDEAITKKHYMTGVDKKMRSEVVKFTRKFGA